MKIFLFLLAIVPFFGLHFLFAFLEWRRCRGRLAPELDSLTAGAPPQTALHAPGMQALRLFWFLVRSKASAAEFFRIAIIVASYCLLLASPALAGEGSDYVQPPVRVEIGGSASDVTTPYGNWYSEYFQVWLRSNSFFIPAFTVESQGRPGGTQMNYAFFSYTNWTKSFYTTEGFSYAPGGGGTAVYYPGNREDVKAFWKITPGKRVVLSGGFTRFDFGAPGRGQIYNAGAIYYRGHVVVEGNLFINRNQPRNLVSASGALSAQYGREGRYWFGATVSGGQQLYNFNGNAPTDISLFSYSMEGFYRKWITRHMGYKVSFHYLKMLDTYNQTGGATSLFFDF